MDTKKKTAVIIQARMGSTRLPGKVMKKLAGREMLSHVVDRVRKSRLVTEVIIATSILREDDAIEAFCEKNHITFYRGSNENVLERYYEAAEKVGADTIIRITSDCPLIDPMIIDRCITAFRKTKCDYISNVNPIRSFPRGLDVEVFSFAALEKTHREATEPYEREHVTPYIWQNKNKSFRIGKGIVATGDYRRSYRLCVDYAEDLKLIEKIYNELYKEGEIIDVRSVIKFLDANPKLAVVNAYCEQKALK